MAFDGGAHIASIPHVALNILPDIDMQGAAAVVVLPDIDIRSDAAVVVATATTKSELRPATASLLLRLFALAGKRRAARTPLRRRKHPAAAATIGRIGRHHQRGHRIVRRHSRRDIPRHRPHAVVVVAAIHDRRRRSNRRRQSRPIRALPDHAHPRLRLQLPRQQVSPHRPARRHVVRGRAHPRPRQHVGAVGHCYYWHWHWHCARRRRLRAERLLTEGALPGGGMRRRLRAERLLPGGCCWRGCCCCCCVCCCCCCC